MKKRIISLDINQGSKEYYENDIVNLIDSKQGGYACFSNVHMLIEAYDDEKFKNIVNNATYAFPDGMPIAKCFKFLHKINQPRIAGMDFLPDFLKICDKKKYTIAVVGSTVDVLNRFKLKLEKDHSGIIISTLISPPFGEEWDNESYIKQINEGNTDVVFVALGCPKQEKWMYYNHSKMKSVLFGIGGALPTYVGDVKRAPHIVQKYGFEWLYRLSQEPKRMARRYFYTNSKFLFLLFKTLIIQKAKK